MPLLLINRPHRPVARLLLAHGAGAANNSDVMQALAVALEQQQVEVWRFNFNYMQRQLDTLTRQLPPKMPVLQAEFTEQINLCPSDLPLFIGGKSMGGRVASLLSATPEVNAVFAYGYPFHPPKKDNWRTEHFNQLACPLFIIQGERDPFGQYDEVAGKFWSAVSMCWLPDGDHDFKPRQRSGYNQQQLIQAAALFSREKINEVLEM